MTYRHSFVLGAALALASPISAQTRPDLFKCDGCEAINDRPHDGLSWETTVAGAAEPGDRLVLSGRAFKADGRTPAPNAIVYAYHTNAAGIYPPANDAPTIRSSTRAIAADCRIGAVTASSPRRGTRTAPGKARRDITLER